MAVRTALLLSFIAGTIFGAALLWLIEDSPKPSEMMAPGAGSALEAADPVATGSDAECPEVCLEDFERTQIDLPQELKAAPELTEKFEKPDIALRKPVPDYRGRKRGQVIEFNAGVLLENGFSPEDVDWIQRRWEEYEVERRYLADIEARDEEPPRGGALSDVEHELREDLGDNGFAGRQR